MPNFIYDLDQGTDLWHEWRAAGIGGSDVSTVLAGSSIEVKHLIHRIITGAKLRFTDTIKAAMQRGHDLEPIARQLVNRKTAANFVPACVEADFDKRFRVSLDGISRGENVVLEIKCLAKKTHDETSRVYKATGNAQTAISPRYYAQIQYQLLVTGARLALYAGYNPESAEELVVIPVLPDAEFQWNLRESVSAFLDNLDAARGVPTIISITGFAQQGKDEVARILTQKYGYSRLGHADLLKQEMISKGLLPENMDEATKKKLRQSIVDYSVQMKAEHGEDYWSERLLEIIATAWKGEPFLTVVPDARYLNEITNLESFAERRHVSFESWSIIRPDGKPANAEEAMSVPLAMTQAVFHIENDSTLEALEKIIDERMVRYGL